MQTAALQQIAISKRPMYTWMCRNWKEPANSISRIYVHNDTERFDNTTNEQNERKRKKEKKRIHKWLHEIETLPIQDAIHTAQNTNELTTKSKNFINVLISGSQDIQKEGYKLQANKKSESARDKKKTTKWKLKSNYTFFSLPFFCVSLNRRRCRRRAN